MKQQHTLQPKLRFPEFEGDWIETKLKEITSLITKGTTPKSFYTQGINFVKLESLDGFNIDKRKFVYIDSETHNNELKRSKLKVNDILFAIAGATVGKVAYVKQDILPANTNQALAIIRLKENVNHNYILQILSSRQMKNYIYMNMSVGAQPNISLEQLNNFCYKSPSLPEQQKIADYLSTIDTKINLLEEKKEQLVLYKKAMMQKLFAQEIRFKDDNGNDFPEWKEKRLGDFIIVKVGATPSTSKKEYWDGNIGWINSGELKDGKIYKPSKYITELGLKNSSTFLLPKGTVVLAMTGATLGKLGILMMDSTANQSVAGFVPNSSFINEYLFYYLMNFQNKIFEKAGGAAQIGINKFNIESLKIDIPSLPEQQKIADFLSAIDKSIEKVTEQISQTQSFKKAMLQGMFV